MFIKTKVNQACIIATVCTAAAVSSIAAWADSGASLRVGSNNRPVVEGIETSDAGVSPESIAEHLHKQLKGKTVGYAFVIADDGRLAKEGQGGYARVPKVDGDGVPFTVNTDVNVFSVSKTITAIAMLQLMDKLSLAPTDPIADWLPPNWVPGLGFGAAGITFSDLLTHDTGIIQTIAKLDEESEAFEALSPNTYAGIQAIVEHGIYPEFLDVSGVSYGDNYKNANFKLAAILIWRMALASGAIGSNSELSADALSAAGYQHYVRTRVLQPAGVDGFCYPTGPDELHALAYDVDLNNYPLIITQGSAMGSFESLYSCGPKNWWLSAMDLAAVAAHLQHGKLLSDERREQMDDLKLGWSDSSNSSSNPNRYWHGGLGKYTKLNRLMYLHASNPFNPTDSWLAGSVSTNDRIHSCLMKLPGGIEATVLINSDIRGSTRNACDVLHVAYDSAS